MEEKDYLKVVGRIIVVISVDRNLQENINNQSKRMLKTSQDD